MVSANLVFVISSKHQIKRWRAPNGLVLDISNILVHIQVAQTGWATLMKRWKEVEHGTLIVPPENISDPDYLLTALTSTFGFYYERNLPDPITTKFLTFAMDREITTGMIVAWINGNLRKATVEELAYEIAAKNA